LNNVIKTFGDVWILKLVCIEYVSCDIGLIAIG
jgi:hypothetical protein